MYTAYTAYTALIADKTYTAYTAATVPSYIAIWLECVRNIAWALAALCCWCWMDTGDGIDHK